MNWAAIDLQTIGPTGLLSLVVIFILVGFLVPRWQVKRMEREHEKSEKRLTDERDEWKAAYFASDKTVRELSGQLQASLEQGRTTEAVIRAIPQREAASDG